VPALLAMLSVPHGRQLGVHDLLELVAAGDPGARRVVHDAGLAVGRVLADLCNTLNPEAIIVGGELSAAGEPLLTGITQAVGRYALPAAAEAVAVKPGTLGDRAEVLGALALVIGDTERLRSAGLVALREAAVPRVAT
jgi:predicted NBD/HSP70 family sugar kinase